MFLNPVYQPLIHTQTADEKTHQRERERERERDACRKTDRKN